MARMIGLFALCIFFIFASSTTLVGQSAEEILEKMIDAQGGRETLEKIEDRTVAGTMEVVHMGTHGSVKIYWKKPNKRRTEFEMEGMTATHVYDGKTAWGVNPQTGKAMEMPPGTATTFKRQALEIEALLHPDDYGITYAYKGEEKVKDRDCHVLEQTHSDGYKATLSVDAESYLPVKSKAKDRNPMGAEVDAESFFSDYREVSGVSVPHKISMFHDGEAVMHFTISEVVFNSGLEDSLFTMNE
jgi:outer membrane lipoprotein-sorting protein